MKTRSRVARVIPFFLHAPSNATKIALTDPLGALRRPATQRVRARFVAQLFSNKHAGS